MHYVFKIIYDVKLRIEMFNFSENKGNFRINFFKYILFVIKIFNRINLINVFFIRIRTKIFHFDKLKKM